MHTDTKTQKHTHTHTNTNTHTHINTHTHSVCVFLHKSSSWLSMFSFGNLRGSVLSLCSSCSPSGFAVSKFGGQSSAVLATIVVYAIF